VAEKLPPTLKEPPLSWEQKYRLEFMVDADTMEKIERAKPLLSTKYPKGVALETLLGELLESYLERNDPDGRDSTDNDIDIDNLNRSR
jgi:hypothetical protein